MAESGFIIRVSEAGPLVQALRERYDESARLGVPAHITVLFPFLPPERIDTSVLERIRRVVGSARSFEFSLSTVARFPATAYHAPEPPAPFVALTEALVAEFPQFPPFGGEFPAIIPHLTVAHGMLRKLASWRRSLSPNLRSMVQSSLFVVRLSCSRIRAATGGKCMYSTWLLLNQPANPSIERTPSSVLRTLPAAAHVKR